MYLNILLCVFIYLYIYINIYVSPNYNTTIVRQSHNIYNQYDTMPHAYFATAGNLPRQPKCGGSSSSFRGAESQQQTHAGGDAPYSTLNTAMYITFDIEDADAGDSQADSAEPSVGDINGHNPEQRASDIEVKHAAAVRVQQRSRALPLVLHKVVRKGVINGATLPISTTHPSTLVGIEGSHASTQEGNLNHLASSSIVLTHAMPFSMFSTPVAIFHVDGTAQAELNKGLAGIAMQAEAGVFGPHGGFGGHPQRWVEHGVFQTGRELLHGKHGCNDRANNDPTLAAVRAFIYRGIQQYVSSAPPDRGAGCRNVFTARPATCNVGVEERNKVG